MTTCRESGMVWDGGSGLTVLVPVQRVRYTHGSVNEEFVHGPHRGKNREEVATRLKSEQDSPLLFAILEPSVRRAVANLHMWR